MRRLSLRFAFSNLRKAHSLLDNVLGYSNARAVVEAVLSGKTDSTPLVFQSGTKKFPVIRTVRIAKIKSELEVVIQSSVNLSSPDMNNTSVEGDLMVCRVS